MPIFSFKSSSFARKFSNTSSSVLPWHPAKRPSSAYPVSYTHLDVYKRQAPSNPNHSNTAIPNSAIPNAAVPNAAVPLGKKKRTFNIGNFVIWAGCVIAFISLFLPFASASFLGFSQSVSLFDTEDGIFFIVTIVATALLNFTRLNLLPTIGSAVMVFFLCLEVNLSLIHISGWSIFGEK